LYKYLGKQSCIFFLQHRTFLFFKTSLKKHNFTKMKRILFIALLLFIGNSVSYGQEQAEKEEDLIQFSGQILTEENGQLVPVPYVNVYLKNKKRGTYTDMKGFFSFVAAKGEHIIFSSVSYKTVEKKIPDTLSQKQYSVIQLLSKDNKMLPEFIVFPWPSREHFKIEFLAMNIHDEMQKRAAENLSERAMRRARKELAYDGKENAQYYLREQAKQYYSAGQFKPMNIFSPLAWQKFFQDWKSGKFRQKADTEQ
jgi:CarboxypepD_reg-like domain